MFRPPDAISEQRVLEHAPDPQRHRLQAALLQSPAAS